MLEMPHAAGSVAARTQPAPGSVRPAEPLDLEALWHVAGGIAIAILLALGLFVSIRQFLLAGQEADLRVIRTTQDVFNLILFSTHIVVGTILIVVWPLALWVAVALVEPEDIPLKSVAVTGLLFASIAYSVLWAPVWLVPYALLVLLVASLIPILATFNLSYGRGILVWGIQAALVAAAAVSSFGAVEGAAALDSSPLLSGMRPAMTAPPVRACMRFQACGSASRRRSVGSRPVPHGSTTRPTIPSSRLWTGTPTRVLSWN